MFDTYIFVNDYLLKSRSFFSAVISIWIRRSFSLVDLNFPKMEIRQKYRFLGKCQIFYFLIDRKKFKAQLGLNCIEFIVMKNRIRVYKCKAFPCLYLCDIFYVCKNWSRTCPIRLFPVFVSMFCRVFFRATFLVTRSFDIKDAYLWYSIFNDT